jgi:hypothetical protein
LKIDETVPNFINKMHEGGEQGTKGKRPTIGPENKNPQPTKWTRKRRENKQYT